MSSRLFSTRVTNLIVVQSLKDYWPFPKASAVPSACLSPFVTVVENSDTLFEMSGLYDLASMYGHLSDDDESSAVHEAPTGGHEARKLRQQFMFLRSINVLFKFPQV